MNQRLAFLLAGTLTAFMVVLMGGVAMTVLVRAFVPAPTSVQTEFLPTNPAPAVAATSQESIAPLVAARLTPEQATRIAQTTLPRTHLSRTPELVNYNGTVAYEVVLDRGTIYVDANLGTVLSSATNPAAQTGGSERRNEKERHDDHDEEDDDD